MSERSVYNLLLDIRDSVDNILEYTRNIEFNSFINDQMRFDAVIRNFTVIGEAVSRIPKKFIGHHNQIQWKEIKDYRNVIVHEYFGIDIYITWDIIQADIPELKKQIETLIAEMNIDE